jgi:hypothetical protein
MKAFEENKSLNLLAIFKIIHRDTPDFSTGGGLIFKFGHCIGLTNSRNQANLKKLQLIPYQTLS